MRTWQNHGSNTNINAMATFFMIRLGMLEKFRATPVVKQVANEMLNRRVALPRVEPNEYSKVEAISASFYLSASFQR